jgi:hypothetical protein
MLYFNFYSIVSKMPVKNIKKLNCMLKFTMQFFYVKKLAKLYHEKYETPFCYCGAIH